MQELKPDTEIITAVRGAVPPERLLRLSTFSLEKTIQQQPNFVGGGGHGHPHAHTRLGFGTVGVELSEKPLSWVTHYHVYHVVSCKHADRASILIVQTC